MHPWNKCNKQKVTWSWPMISPLTAIVVNNRCGINDWPTNGWSNFGCLGLRELCSPALVLILRLHWLKVDGVLFWTAIWLLVDLPLSKIWVRQLGSTVTGSCDISLKTSKENITWHKRTNFLDFVFFMLSPHWRVWRPPHLHIYQVRETARIFSAPNHTSQNREGTQLLNITY